MIDAMSNYAGFEEDLESPRDGLMHMACAALDYTGFPMFAWSSPVYQEMGKAFDACLSARLQPRVVMALIMSEKREPVCNDLDETINFAKSINKQIEEIIDQMADNHMNSHL
ncbi:MAG: hypothetical protein Q7S53_02245 [bacterium]|nr:hypothetical protein [bacterium]